MEMKKWKYGNEEIEQWKWAALLSHRRKVTAAAVFFFKKKDVEGLITLVCSQGPEGPEPLL